MMVSMRLSSKGMNQSLGMHVDYRIRILLMLLFSEIIHYLFISQKLLFLWQRMGFVLSKE